MLPITCMLYTIRKRAFLRICILDECLRTVSFQIKYKLPSTLGTDQPYNYLVHVPKRLLVLQIREIGES